MVDNDGMLSLSLGPPRVLLALALVMASGSGGCIPTLANRAPAEAIPPARLVGLPPQVLVHTLDAYNHNSVDEDATSAVSWEAEHELGDMISKLGVRPAEHLALMGCGALCARFARWGGLATLEIGLQREKIRNYGSHSVADWRFRADLSAARAALDADYALFVVFKQTRQTDGRKVLLALGGGHTFGKQIDAACIADLRDGRMIRCVSECDDTGDIDDPGRVRAVLRTLLRVLFAPTPPQHPALAGAPAPRQ